MFAFALYDAAKNDWLIARDPIGIIPLYVGRRKDGSLAVSLRSSRRSSTICETVEEFPPGHYHDAPRRQARALPRARLVRGRAASRIATVDPAELREALSDAVHSHLMTDVPYGVLLSGGLDSSVIGALAAGFAGKRVESGDSEAAWWPRLHSFAIGLSGSPDLAAAKRAAEGIGTVHHGFEFTVQEGLDALRDVIWHIESFDTTTVRASTPMYLMARRIRATGVKMVLSGEGSDEIFGGYLYFHKAPQRARVPRGARAQAAACCTSTTACARTSRWRRGASRRASRSSTRASWTSRCASRRGRRWSLRAASRRRSCASVPRRAPRRDPLAPEGAVLRRRRLLVDRLAEGSRRGARLRSRADRSAAIASRSARR